MKIVIVGAGTVGTAICAQLINENHDLTVVDKRQSVLTELSDVNDVAGVQGNGADISVLKKAGAARADLLIAVTSSDEINILCCAAAVMMFAAFIRGLSERPESSLALAL